MDASSHSNQLINILKSSFKDSLKNHCSARCLGKINCHWGLQVRWKTWISACFYAMRFELYCRRIFVYSNCVFSGFKLHSRCLKNFNEIKEGSQANVTLVDLEKQTTIDETSFVSKSKNSCFLGRKVQGAVLATICNGTLHEY